MHKNGRYWRCREKRRAYAHRYREANLESLRAKQREADRRYREANLESVRARKRRYYAVNIEKERQRWRRYREENRAKIRERNSLSYWKRKEQGVCTECGGPLLSETRCWDCLNKQEEHRALSL